ncbi:Gfo/Idh/MocA family oxidoreductase [Candidatus Desantisbacteria bacterium]|nr:Gfo/Idh/MocA family oxidoreductase [Candidatus Desantisbacteria bacterium]
MKVLQIGLGSMGKRRVRNCLALGAKDIIGFDFREDRRNEAKDKYGIKTTDKLTDELLSERDVYIISTPPNHHLEYIQTAVKNKKPAFVEASVLKQGLEAVSKEAKEKNVLIAPSCTFRFFPPIKTIKEIVQSKKYGKICNFVYHMGQYLPDWHPWEDIRDFYVSKKETSATREMIPFELTWILDITGIPQEVSAFYGKTFNLGVDIDDVYSVNLRYKDFLGTLIVDVVSRFATRSLTLNLEKAQIRWNWEDRIIKLYEADSKRWIHYFEPEGQAESGYNKNIVEEMYVQEINAFLDSVKNKKPFPNTLDEDIKILTILEKSEQTNKGNKI